MQATILVSLVLKIGDFYWLLPELVRFHGNEYKPK